MWLSALLQGIPVIGKLFDSITSVTNRLTDAKIAAINAKTEEEKLRWQGEARELELKLEAHRLAAQSPMFRFIQNGMGLIALLILAKLVVYDQMLGLGYTNALGKDVWDFIKIVVGFYFVTTWFRR